MTGMIRNSIGGNVCDCVLLRGSPIPLWKIESRSNIGPFHASCVITKTHIHTKISSLSFPHVILFGLISSVFWLHQVVSLEYACINSNSASRTISCQEDQDVLTFVININLRIT